MKRIFWIQATGWLKNNAPRCSDASTDGPGTVAMFIVRTASGQYTRVVRII